MLRISVFIFTMLMISNAPEMLGQTAVYKDYIFVALLSLLLKPWLEEQFD